MASTSSTSAASGAAGGGSSVSSRRPSVAAYSSECDAHCRCTLAAPNEWPQRRSRIENPGTGTSSSSNGQGRSSCSARRAMASVYSGWAGRCLA